MWWQVLILIFVIFIVTFQWKKRKYMKLNAKFKNTIKEMPFVGHAYLFIGNGEDRMNAINTIGQEALNQGGVASVWMAHQFYLMVADPEFADVILKTCLEKPDVLRIVKFFIGNGHSFAPESAMGVNLQSQHNLEHPFLKALDEGLDLTTTRICRPWLHSDTVFKMLPQYRRMIKLKDLITDYMGQIIKSKRKIMKDELQAKVDLEDRHNWSHNKLRTFLELIVESSGDDHGYTNLELREEILILIFAGTDTSAVGISFTALMLSRYPDVQEKVYKELKDVFDDSSRTVVADDLSQLKYLEAVIKETMRLYPPGPIVTRTADQDICLSSDTTLVAGTNIVVNIRAIHRNPRYWGPDAEEFRPERFIDITLKHPAQYMPFSYGPRNCTGYRYAMMSMKTALATLLRQYRLLPVTLRDTACNKGSQTSTAEQHPPLRLRFDFMMRDVDDFQIELESRGQK